MPTPPDRAARESELERIVPERRRARRRGGSDRQRRARADVSTTSAPIAALPQIHELNIGHSIVARAVFVGLEAAVREMKAAMLAARGR